MSGGITERNWWSVPRLEEPQPIRQREDDEWYELIDRTPPKKPPLFSPCSGPHGLGAFISKATRQSTNTSLLPNRNAGHFRNRLRRRRRERSEDVPAVPSTPRRGTPKHHHRQFWLFFDEKRSARSPHRVFQKMATPPSGLCLDNVGLTRSTETGEPPPSGKKRPQSISAGIPRQRRYVVDGHRRADRGTALLGIQSAVEIRRGKHHRRSQ